MNEPITPAQGAVVIEASGLHKRYGDTVAVRGLSFSVRSGEVLGLLGPNGAGKTTTINMLTTLIPIDEGTATVAGHDVAGESGAVRRVIGLAGQSAAVDEKLTARENLRLFGRFYKIPGPELAARVEELIAEFDLADFADRPVETYSGGQRRRLDVVAALVARPAALFLDEPTTGLDPRSRAELWRAVRSLADAGTAIVLTTQYLDEADRLADEIVLIDEGVAVARGTPGDLKRGLERDRLEVHLSDSDAYTAARALIGSESDLVADEAAGLIQVPVADGAAASLAILRRLDDAGVAIVDFQLRRPTLDDVFLTLTRESRSSVPEGGKS